MPLSDWIHQNYLKEKNTIRYKRLFLLQKPFPHLEFKNFFKEEKAKLIFNELQKEKFFLKESDLFQFKQTDDLKSTNNKILQEFRSFLSSKKFIDYMNTITFISLKHSVIDMSGSLYENTDFLLCHDDKIEERKIAYFYYLSDLKKSDGGYLNLFSSKNNKPTKIEKQIIPQFNTFAFFLVSEKSFHSVEEVVSKKQRYAISGWFHGN